MCILLRMEFVFLFIIFFFNVLDSEMNFFVFGLSMRDFVLWIREVFIVLDRVIEELMRGLNIL